MGEIVVDILPAIREARRMNGWRPQFAAALNKLAEISSEMDQAGFSPPVLVGGAAVELYTQGAVTRVISTWSVVGSWRLRPS
jgi:hypothetical protein